MGFTSRAGGNGATTTTTTTQGRSFVAQARQQNEAMQPVASSDPVEIEAMDGQRMTVTFDDVRNFICKEATIAECRIFLKRASSTTSTLSPRKPTSSTMITRTVIRPVPLFWARPAT